MYTVKGVKLPSVTASWKHILCFSVTVSFTVSILLYDENIIFLKKFFLYFIQEKSAQKCSVFYPTIVIM